MAIRKFGWFDFRNYAGNMQCLAANAAAAFATSTTADQQNDAWWTPDGTLYMCQILAASANLSPILTSNGWTLPYSTANSGGIEIVPNIISNANSKSCFTLGTDVGFWVQATFQCATVANATMIGVGFRTAGAFNGTSSNYATIANWVASATLYNDVIGVFLETASLLHTLQHSNTVTGTDTSTTVTMANTTNVTLRCQIATGGTAVTYLLNGATFATGGTNTCSGTDVLVPFFAVTAGSGSTTTTNLQTFGWGYL